MPPVGQKLFKHWGSVFLSLYHPGLCLAMPINILLIKEGAKLKRWCWDGLTASLKIKDVDLMLEIR